MDLSNRQIIEGWTEEGWNSQNLDVISKYFHEDFVGHDPYQLEMVGLETGRNFMAGILGTFSDFHLRIDDSVEEGELIACRYTATGKHMGEFMGCAGTNCNVTFPVMAMWKIRDQKISDVWQHWDALGIVNQIKSIHVPSLVFDPGIEASSKIDTSEHEANKNAVSRWMNGAWNQGKFDLIDELFAEDFLFWDASEPPADSRESFRAWAARINHAFPLPHRHVQIDHLIAEGNKTAYRITVLGKQMGQFANVNPTGRLVNAGAIIIGEHENGKFKRAWQIFDVLRVLGQLGVTA